MGYVEFRVARRLLVGGAFRRMLSGQLMLREFEESLAAARTVSDFWKAIRENCKTLGFSQVRLQLGGEVYEDRNGYSDAENCWHLRIPLSDLSYINLSREFNSPVQPMVVAPFVDLLRNRLQTKLQPLETEMLFPPDLVVTGTVAAAKVAARR